MSITSSRDLWSQGLLNGIMSSFEPNLSVYPSGGDSKLIKNIPCFYILSIQQELRKKWDGWLSLDMIESESEDLALVEVVCDRSSTNYHRLKSGRFCDDHGYPASSGLRSDSSDSQSPWTVCIANYNLSFF